MRESRQFQLPEKIYGRDEDISELENLLGHGQNSKGRIVFLKGPSGIGKTAIVKELFKNKVYSSSLYLNAKYDQINSESLNSPLIQILSDFFKNLLTEKESSIKKWKLILQDELGVNAKVLTDIIPELELIMGAQPEPAILGPAEAQNRFELLFSQLFICLGRFQEKPLVVFVDDLQWASARNIDLLQKIITHPNFVNTLMICAYRDNEVDLSHPLETNLRTVEGTNFFDITVTPLAFQDVKQLIEDTIGEIPTLGALTNLVLGKTNGNPFHVKQFLKHLHRNELISYDEKMQDFLLDLHKIEKEQISDNVVEIILQQMKNLSRENQNILSCVASIGNSFSIQEISMILDLSPGQSFDFIEESINEQYITQLSSNDDKFKFIHDRIQEAAYNLMSKEERSKVHGRIAHKLIEISGENKPLRDIEIAIHLNKAIETLCVEEKIRAIEINISAARISKDSTAFKQGLKFIDMAYQIAVEEQIEVNLETLKQIIEERSTLLYLNGKYDDCEKFTLEAIKKYEKEKILVVKLMNQLVIQYTAQGRYADSISIGIKALKNLGIILPTENLKEHVSKELESVKQLTKNISIPELSSQDEMQDEDKKLAMSVLINLDSPCYLSNIDLYCIVISKMVELSIIHGPVPESAKGYASYGIVLCAHEEYKRAFEFNLLGNDIADRYNHLGQICRTNHTMANHVQFWTEHIGKGDAYNDKGFSAGHDAGEYL